MSSKLRSLGIACEICRAGYQSRCVHEEFATPTGAHIPIEDRGSAEVCNFHGVRTTPDRATAINPAFDVTPAELITAIVTERRVVRPPEHPAAVLDEEEA